MAAAEGRSQCWFLRMLQTLQHSTRAESRACTRTPAKAQHLTAYFCVYSYSKLPKKTTPLYTYKKRKALADAVRELEQEQAQQVNTHDTNRETDAQPSE